MGALFLTSGRRKSSLEPTAVVNTEKKCLKNIYIYFFNSSMLKNIQDEVFREKGGVFLLGVMHLAL